MAEVEDALRAWRMSEACATYLAPVCAECNSGSWRLLGGQSVRLMHRILRIKEQTFGPR